MENRKIAVKKKVFFWKIELTEIFEKTNIAVANASEGNYFDSN